MNSFFRGIRLKLGWKKYSLHKDYQLTVFCNNCVGAMVLHDFGLRFNSPFVNLFIRPNEYIRILENPEVYLKEDTSLVDITDDSSYPIGLLGGDVRINFMHYNTFEEAKGLWFKRIRRIRWGEVIAILVQQKGSSSQLLKRFESLSYRRKIALVNFPSHGIYYQIKGFENEESLGIITDYKGFFGTRYYDDFDFKTFFEIE